MLLDGSDHNTLGTMNVPGDSTRDGEATRVEWHRDGNAARPELQTRPV